MYTLFGLSLIKPVHHTLFINRNFLKLCLVGVLNIKIYHEYKGGIEKSVPRMIDWHHGACIVMTNGAREGHIVLSHPHTNNRLN